MSSKQSVPNTTGQPGGPGSGSRRTGESELRLILVGKSGGGKSATGNTILGEEKFESILKAKPVTQTCSEGSRIWNGRKVVVIDTPAIFDTKDSNEQTTREINHCIELSSPGPHALVLVIQLGHFTEEDQHAVKKVQKIFCPEAMKYTIVLFTRREDLRSGTLEEYIFHPDNKQLLQLIEQCQGRYCAFNNKATGEEQTAQADELMTKIARMVKEHKDHLVCKAPEKLLREGLGSDSRRTGESELRIILVGKSGGGKSATGNPTLWWEKFESVLKATPVTQTCSEGRRTWNGRKVVVIDIPAIFDTEHSDEHTTHEISRCMELSAPGPHALVLMAQLGHFTEEDQRAMRRVQEIFGPKATTYTIVLFIHRGEVLRSGTLKEYIPHSNNKQLRQLIQMCQGRYCAFNNKATGDEQAAQAKELMTKIARMVERNNQSFYTNEVYAEVEKLLKEKALFYEKDERPRLNEIGEAEMRRLTETQKSYEEKHNFKADQNKHGTGKGNLQKPKCQK